LLRLEQMILSHVQGDFFTSKRMKSHERKTLPTPCPVTSQRHRRRPRSRTPKGRKGGHPCLGVLHRLLIQSRPTAKPKPPLPAQRARIPWTGPLKTFPFDKQPGVRKAQIQQLSGLDFLERKENIVFIGNPGTGKSGLAVGLLRQALLSGYRGRLSRPGSAG